MSKQKLYVLILIMGITVAVAYMGARFFVTPFVLSIPSEFEYAADVISFDNFFDPDSGTFGGESRSVTTFLYHGEAQGVREAHIANTFDVRTLEGDAIINVERTYRANRFTWAYVDADYDNHASVHLFGPRYVGQSDSFFYRHVNYDEILQLVFDGEEIVHGVRTYRFTTNFVVDQTQNLTHLPDVPSKRGVNTDVSLTLWIEPVSGWLVKYSDSAVAYFYDKETGKRLLPWNKFKNFYSQASAQKHARIAQERKTLALILDFGLPFIVSFLVFFVLVRKFFPQQKYTLRIGGLLLVLVGIGGALYMYTAHFSTKPDPVVIGISRFVPIGNSAFEEAIDGFKDALAQAGYKEEEDISYIDRTANARPEVQYEVAREFLEDDVDLIFSLTTTGTQILQEVIPNRPIVFSVVTYPVESGLIASVTNSKNNLVGTRNWIPVQEQLQIFRTIIPTVTNVGFIHRTGESNSTIQFEEMQKAGDVLGITIHSINARDFVELQAKLDSDTLGVDALYSSCDTLVQGEAENFIIQVAKEHGLPSFACNASGPQKGDLVGTVADFYTIGRLAGEKAALILEGASPSSLETETVSRAFIYVNLTTARELGVTIPQEIRAIAELITQ